MKIFADRIWLSSKFHSPEIRFKVTAYITFFLHVVLAFLSSTIHKCINVDFTIRLSMYTSYTFIWYISSANKRQKNTHNNKNYTPYTISFLQPSLLLAAYPRSWTDSNTQAIFKVSRCNYDYIQETRISYYLSVVYIIPNFFTHTPISSLIRVSSVTLVYFILSSSSFYTSFWVALPY